MPRSTNSHDSKQNYLTKYGPLTIEEQYRVDPIRKFEETLNQTLDKAISKELTLMAGKNALLKFEPNKFLD